MEVGSTLQAEKKEKKAQAKKSNKVIFFGSRTLCQ